jgi:hypothetical protein
MAELKRKDEELTTADLAGTTTPDRRPQLVRSEDRLATDQQLDEQNAAYPLGSHGSEDRAVTDQSSNTIRTQAQSAQPALLFSEGEVGEFRTRWSNIQTGFVDEPRRAVEDADNLVASLMKKLAEGFANERAGLEKQWDSGDNVSTEDLRIALQRYRSFFDRLLKA